MSKHGIFFKRISSAVISVSMFLSIIGISVSAASTDTSTAYVTPYAASASNSLIASGWSNSVYWQIDKNGLLSISGSGDWKREYKQRDGANPVYMAPWYDYREYITSAKVELTGTTDASSMFQSCNKMTSMDLSGFDTSKVTNMYAMFDNCSAMKVIDLSSLDTRNVTDMSCMFIACMPDRIDLSSFNTSKVTTMFWMFLGWHNKNGVDIDLSSFDTSNVTNMFGMFAAGSGIQSINLSSFDTRNVTSMGEMFMMCDGLSKLDLSSFDVRNVSDMGDMLDGCKSLLAIRTPKNVSVDCKLPKTFYNTDGTATQYLPKYNLESITLTNTPGAEYEFGTNVSSTENSVTLKWSKVDGAEKYRIYKYENGKYKRVKTTKGNSTVIKNLSPDTTYKFIVRSYVNGKWSKVSKSNVIKVKTAAASNSYKQIYKELLLNIINDPQKYEYSWGVASAMFELFDINSDGIPELFVSENACHAAGTKIYTVSDGKIVKISNGIGSDGYSSATTNGYLCGSWYGQGVWISNYYKLEGNTAVHEHEHVNREEWEGSGRYNDDELYSIDGKYVSKETYYAARNQYNSMDWHNCLGRKYNLDIATVEEVFS